VLDFLEASVKYLAGPTGVKTVEAIFGKDDYINVLKKCQNKNIIQSWLTEEAIKDGMSLSSFIRKIQSSIKRLGKYMDGTTRTGKPRTNFKTDYQNGIKTTGATLYKRYKNLQKHSVVKMELHKAHINKLKKSNIDHNKEMQKLFVKMRL
jgi:hypothetical protein